jgi:hypothetical protein
VANAAAANIQANPTPTAQHLENLLMQQTIVHEAGQWQLHFDFVVLWRDGHPIKNRAVCRKGNGPLRLRVGGEDRADELKRAEKVARG